MLDTYSAWQTGKPIQSRLPGVYSQVNKDPIVSWLLDYWEDFLLFQKQQVDLLLTQNLDPLICDPEYLDFLAFLHGYTDQFWDRNWPISAKRLLIYWATREIFVLQGTLQSIHRVLLCFGIQNIVENVNDFIVDVSEVGEPIGDLAWRYKIYLPTVYQGTSVEQQVRNLDYIFGVGYCQKQIIFTDERSY